RQFIGQLKRDLLIGFRSRGDFINPLLFYALAIMLFPFGLGTDASILSILAPGVMWVLALLSVLMSMDSLFQRDYLEGTLEQQVLQGDPLFSLVLAKVLAHWITTGLPLVLVSPLLAVMLYLPVESIPVLMLTLALGTPVLSLLGSVGAALTVSIRGGGLLLALLVLPLYIPVLIFGASATAMAGNPQGIGYTGQLLWLSVFLVLSITLTPFAGSAALRISLEQ
ncbi:MAG: heme exporter protein CcmB, partial [Pseudomonadales bacterium]|nr:heme exporter protein CcmB [Pseudomonadales bacterium]